MLDEQDTALGTASVKHHKLLTDMKNLKEEAEGNIVALKAEMKRYVYWLISIYVCVAQTTSSRIAYKYG